MVYADRVRWIGLQARKAASYDHVGPTLHILFSGSYGAPEGCNAWGGGGVITMCLGVGQVCHMFVPTILEMGGLQILLFQELIDNGNIEELFLHEGSHVSVDSLLEVKHHFGPLFCILPKNRKISTSLFAYHHKCILT